jgi:hypothetical protein
MMIIVIVLMVVTSQVSILGSSRMVYLCTEYFDDVKGRAHVQIIRSIA